MIDFVAEAKKILPRLDEHRLKAIKVGNKRASAQALVFGMAHDIIRGLISVNLTGKSRYDTGYGLQANYLLDRIEGRELGATIYDPNDKRIKALAEELKQRDIFNLKSAALMSKEELERHIAELERT